MLRLLLLALLLIAFATGLQRGWLEVRWDRLGADLQRNFSSDQPAAPAP
jgi:Flp pilus assembly pilin Flp